MMESSDLNGTVRTIWSHPVEKSVPGAVDSGEKRKRLMTKGLTKKVSDNSIAPL